MGFLVPSLYLQICALEGLQRSGDFGFETNFGLVLQKKKNINAKKYSLSRGEGAEVPGLPALLGQKPGLAFPDHVPGVPIPRPTGRMPPRMAVNVV